MMFRSPSLRSDRRLSDGRVRDRRHRECCCRKSCGCPMSKTPNSDGKFSEFGKDIGYIANFGAIGDFVAEGLFG